MSDQTPAHRPLEAIRADIVAHPAQGNDWHQHLINELIAAVRAERPSSVHLDRGMVDQLRHGARILNDYGSVAAFGNAERIAADLCGIADAIEASLAPQTPEALPTTYARPTEEEIAHWVGPKSPVALAPVEGRPDVEGMQKLEAAATEEPWTYCPSSNVADLPCPATARIVDNVQHGRRTRFIAVCDGQGLDNDANAAFIVAARRYVPQSRAYIKRLEADLSRLTLEYRVHMRNITEGEAARKAEVAQLEATLRMMLRSANPNESEHPTMFGAWQVARALLRLKAEQEGK